MSKGKNKTCCILSQWNLPKDKVGIVEQELQKYIQSAIEEDYSLFICGFSTKADLIFASIVTEQRKQGKEIYLEAALSHPTAIKSKGAAFNELLSQCNQVGRISPHFTRNCTDIRNQFMVDHSNRVIAVYDGKEKGKITNALRYVELTKKELHFITLKDC